MSDACQRMIKLRPYFRPSSELLPKEQHFRLGLQCNEAEQELPNLRFSKFYSILKHPVNKLVLLILFLFLVAAKSKRGFLLCQIGSATNNL